MQPNKGGPQDACLRRAARIKLQTMWARPQITGGETCCLAVFPLSPRRAEAQPEPQDPSHSKEETVGGACSPYPCKARRCSNPDSQAPVADGGEARLNPAAQDNDAVMHNFVAFVDFVNKSHRTTPRGNKAPVGMDRGPRGPHIMCSTYIPSAKHEGR